MATEDIIKVAILAEEYKQRLFNTQSMSEISDIVDEISSAGENNNYELAKMVLKKFIFDRS